MQIYQRLRGFTGSLGILAAFIIIFLAILVIAGLNRPAWGDEEHFVLTIRQFGQGITLDTLRTYSEMSTPLPFILYAAWGKIVGFELPALRLLSLAVAVITIILFWRLCYKIFHDAFSASMCAIFLFINPYMVGFSIFVFPDMLTILCLVVGMLALLDDRPVVLVIAIAFGLLSRQYFIFFPVAVLIYSLYRSYRKNRRQLKIITATLLGMVPILLLFWLWQGVSPQNDLKELYLGYAFKFYPPALILYIALLGTYLLPLVIMRWRKYYRNLAAGVMAVIVSGIYFLFPVKASPPSLESGITTVGYLHRFLIGVLGPYANWAFYGLFLLSLPVLIQLIHTWLKDFKKPDLTWLDKLAIILFLIIMPFSYLWWEKYFVLILPIAIIEIYRPVELPHP
jgi:hypothetical protein